MVPSMTECGSCRKMTWSLQVPGSDSSPLTRTYFGFSDFLGTKLHFMPVGKPAPPRPRRPLAFMVLMIQLGSLRRWPSARPCSRRARCTCRCRPRPAEAAGDDLDFIGMRDEGRHYFSSFPWPSR